MTFHSLPAAFITVFVVGTIVACTGKSEKMVTESVATENNVQPAAKAGLCPNGQAAKSISGECSGGWRVTKNTSGTTCEFEWGPKVSCPDGTKALGISDVCYGVTGMKADSSVTTPEQCVTAFGKHPISPKYSLECCS